MLPRQGLAFIVTNTRILNPDVEAVFIKKGALVLTDESGISLSEEDFDK
jgi:hypothetical protein